MKYIIELNSNDDDFLSEKKLLDNALKNSCFKTEVFNAIRSINKYDHYNGTNYTDLDKYEAFEKLKEQLVEVLEEELI